MRHGRLHGKLWAFVGAAAFQSYGTLRLRHFPDRCRHRRTPIRLPLHDSALLTAVFFRSSVWSLPRRKSSRSAPHARRPATRQLMVVGALRALSALRADGFCRACHSLGRRCAWRHITAERTLHVLRQQRRDDPASRLEQQRSRLSAISAETLAVTSALLDQTL